MKTQRLLLCLSVSFLLGGFFLYGCGRSVDNQFETNGNKAGDPPPVQSAEIPFDHSAALRKLRNVQVTCPTSDCHPSVGMLASMEGADAAFAIQRCSAILLPGGNILTAAHCLPSEVLSGHVPCSERVQVAFPELDGFSADRTLCVQVLEIGPIPSHTEQASTDYAILKLATQPARPSSAMSAEGLPDQTDAQLHALKASVQNDTDGELRVYRTKIASRTLLLPQFQSTFSAVGTLGGETILHLDSAASGGGVFVNGSLRGLYTRALEVPPDMNTGGRWGALLPEHREKRRLGLITNLACLDPRLRSTTDCNPDLSLQATRAYWEPLQWTGPDAIAKSEQAMRKQITAWSATDSKILRWDMLVAKNFYADPTLKVRFTAVPVCFDKPEAWLNRYSSGKAYKKRVRIPVVFPKWTFQFEFNDYLQLELKIAMDPDSGRSDIALSPADLKLSGQSQVLIEYNDSSNPVSGSLFDSILKACP